MQKTRENSFFKEVAEKAEKSNQEYGLLKNQNKDLLEKMKKVEKQFDVVFNEGNPSQTIQELKKQIKSLQEEIKSLKEENNKLLERVSGISGNIFIHFLKNL